MGFNQGGMPVILQGDPSHYNSPISLKEMVKAIKGESEVIL